MQHKLIITEDGSHSLFVEELNEHYHSIHGAIKESKHVFIEAGLKHVSKLKCLPESASSNIQILEIGFGTGLNAFLTVLESQQLVNTIDYTSIEAFPLTEQIVATLNYSSLLVEETNAEMALQLLFNMIHVAEWNKKIRLTSKLHLHKIHDTLQQAALADKFDLVYYDAFGPTAQPEMWEESIFLKLWNVMSEDGVLVTYCAKGSVKRILKSIGFQVEALQGPPGKREMIRATKTTSE
jgi:tRNA U34 5-methylaminomethyl-2-thiouridine-forming methyltransferase MnmC